MAKKNIAYITTLGGKEMLTFSKTHYEKMVGNVFLYYGAKIPVNLEKHGKLNDKKVLFKFKLKKLFNLNNRFLLEEEQLKHSFKSKRIDVVYIDFGTHAVSILNVCKDLNIPIIVAFLGYDISVHSVVSQHKVAYKNVCEYAYKILIVSKHMKESLVKLGCPEQKIIWSAYPPEDFFFDAKPNYSKNNFFMMGRFVDKKAPYYSILAFKKVVELYPDSKLTIAGDGPLFSICYNLVNYLKLSKNIEFVKKIDQKEAFTYYENSLAFIQHSIVATDGDMEGTPVSILEASLAGLPIISTYHAGIPDVVLHNETGILVEEHDVDAMANAMIFLIKNKDKAKEFGQKGKEFIEKNFSANVHMKIVNNIIQEAYN